jgi:hypothetical protein
VNTPGGTKYIQAIFGFCQPALKDVVGCRSLSVTYVAFQLLKIVVCDLLGEVGNHLDHAMSGRLIGRVVPIAVPSRGHET